MSDLYENVSRNIINNLSTINYALENARIGSEVLTPAFNQKLEKLESIMNQENNFPSKDSSNFSLDSSRHFSRHEINEAFARLASLPKEFDPPKSVKKPCGKALSNLTSTIVRSNLGRTTSLQNVGVSNHQPGSQSNSLSDIPSVVTPKPETKLKELVEKIDEIQQMLVRIKHRVLEYPDISHFGRERHELAKKFKITLGEITEIVNNLEESVNTIEKDDIYLALDEELNELLQQFTKVRQILLFFFFSVKRPL